MKYLFTTLLMALFTLTSHAASEWIDVTDKYIVNPRFENNDITTGWEGTAFSSKNPFENAENYNKNYNTYQTIKGLTPGKYRVSLSAFYRMGTAQKDYDTYKSGSYSGSQYAKLYAKSSSEEKTVSITPASSAALEAGLGGDCDEVTDGSGGWWWWGATYYLPASMEAAYYWFEAGKYKNTVECTVGEDGILTIGIKKEQKISEDWTCLDNWKLEFEGEITSLGMSEEEISLIPHEVRNLMVKALPYDVDYTNVTWKSSNTNVATVDANGSVSAVGTGACIITAVSKKSTTMNARCKVTVTKGEIADAFIINEIMASNIDVYMDPSFNFGSWVELYNPTDRTISLGGLYVSDDPKDLKKHQLIEKYGTLPAKGYALLNFDHYEVWTFVSYRQIDDKLNCEGGTIIISDGTTIFAQQEYPKAISRTSYARTTDGGDTWGLTGQPSPGASNQLSGGFAEVQLEAPVVDKDAQLFTGKLQVCVNKPEGAKLIYTTDGTTPTLTNGEESETGLFNVDRTISFRFRLFKDGYLPSSVVTRTYIYDNGNYPFPIISVVTDDNNLHSVEYGLFEKGPNGRTGHGPATDNEKKNWNMDWDRPVSFEFITTDNECIVSQECDFSMCGGWSRAWTPHSFKLKASKAYDFQNFFAAQLFDKKPYNKNKTLQIRNGGNDNNCRIKDAAVQMVVANSGLNVDYQEWQPVHVFINGLHYAVLNMREPNNKDFAFANYGIDSDEMDQFEINPEEGYVQKKGTDEAYLRLIELSKNAEDEETYAEICKLIDIDEYINYMAVELYCGGTDWPQNNVKGFRDVHDGRFHFVLFDLDFVHGTSTPFTTFFGKQNYTFDAQRGYNYELGKSVEGVKKQEEITFVTLFKNLLKNEAFRKQFIDAFCIVGGSVFQPKRVSSIIGAARDYLSYGNYVDPSSSANQVINGFNSSYNGNLVNQLKSCSDMKLSTTTRQLAKVSANIAEAKVTLNDLELPYTEFDGYLFSPVTLKATAPAGYTFAGWTSGVSATETTIFSTGSSWRYYDGGSLDGQSWTANTYSNSDWKTGRASIGYGKDQNTTTQANLPCYYFRKTFTLSETPKKSDEFTLDFTIDDGMIVYVNGTEAGRYNMPAGTVTYETVASSYAPDNPDTGTLTLPASLFKSGSNVIAVEVHNNNTTSSDILWDATLSQTSQNTTDVEFISTDAEYTLPTSGKQTLCAVFKEIPAEDMLAEGITPVRINEVSADNSIYINDYFKKNDWMELYNTTDEDINIKGMTISLVTDKSKKEKRHDYQVPTDDVTLNTIIPAHGYKIIWCDNPQVTSPDIHTGFKLENKGGNVIIATESYTDTLTYEPHLGTQTFGRYPDGANDVYTMNIPTIAKANKIGSYDTLYIKQDGDVPGTEPDAIPSYTKENGMTIAFTDGVINVKSEDSPIQSVNLYNTSGMKMSTMPSSRNNEHFVTISVGTLSKGIYIVSATTKDGDECHIKFIIK